MTHVTFETAKRLSEARFPQPRPEESQVWYNHAGTVYVITYSYGKTCDYVVRGSNNVWTERGLNDGEVFAPTATDILAQLPGWDLAFTTEAGWQCWKDFSDPNGYIPKIFTNKNPAEACSEAWLFERENSKK